ncbi:MAG: hypothetical protein M0Z79_11160 [Nitrospiraceae bacterium]|nr:hypothetical protein [Nitrospiraceae bacterium]
MKDRWLIISYFANMDAMAPAHHIDDKLIFFREKGIEATLISSPCGSRNRELRHIRIFSPAPSGIRYEVRHFLRRVTARRFWFKFWEFALLLPVYPLYFLEKIFLRLDSTWSWFILASVAGTIRCLFSRPSVIYSTGGPVSGHIAAMIISKITGIPYIAEFQDPLNFQYAAPGKFERRYIHRVEQAIFRTAKAVVFLTEKAAETARERNAVCPEIAVIYPGATPTEKMGPFQRAAAFRIAHFGSLGGSRNLTHLLRALAGLCKEQPGLVDTIRLHLVGNNARDVVKEIEAFGHRELIATYGKLRRQDSIAMMQTVDLLLLIQNTDAVSVETIPSKVYEYLHTGRLILGLVYRNRELRAMLEGMGHVVVEADDEAAIRAALQRCVEQWNKGPLMPVAITSPYTVGRAIDEMISLTDPVSRMSERART